MKLTRLQELSGIICENVAKFVYGVVVKDKNNEIIYQLYADKGDADMEQIRLNEIEIVKDSAKVYSVKKYSIK